MQIFAYPFLKQSLAGKHKLDCYRQVYVCVYVFDVFAYVTTAHCVAHAFKWLVKNAEPSLYPLSFYSIQVLNEEFINQMPPELFCKWVVSPNAHCSTDAAVFKQCITAVPLSQQQACLALTACCNSRGGCCKNDPDINQ